MFGKDDFQKEKDAERAGDPIYSRKIVREELAASGVATRGERNLL